MKLSIPSMQELLEAGVHFGHQVRRGHPKMAKYIFGVRDGVHIINLEDSEKLLQEAAQFAYELGKMDKVLLFVGTKKQAQEMIRDVAQKLNAFYVDFRWLGGLLTNFEEIRKNISKLLDLKEKKEKGELARYTKKEQLLINRKLVKFDKQWGGVAKMEGLPDALFIIDCQAEKTAISEANKMNIPIIGISDSNSDPSKLSYPIPGNDDAIKSIKIITQTIATSYGEGLGKTESKKEKARPDPPAGGRRVKSEKEVKSVLGKESDEIQVEVEAAEEKVEKESVEEASRAE